MKLNLSVLALAMFTVSMAPVAKADTTFSLQLPVLSYTSESSTRSPDVGDDVKTKTDTTTTADLGGAYLNVNIDKLSLYFYPFADLNLISISYWVADPLEVGVNLGVNSFKVDEPKDELATNAFGLFVGYALPITPDQLAAEFYLFADQSTEKGTTADPAGDVKTDKAEMAIKVSADAVVSVAKHVSYVGGINYTMTNSEDKEAKSKTSAGTFGLNLATIRLSF